MTSRSISVGVFGENTLNDTGRWQVHPLFYKNIVFKSGRQTLTVVVKGKPVFAGVDPYATLIDRNAEDNLKGITY